MPDYGMKSFLARYHPRLPLPDQTRTLAAIPLRHEERIIGCLALGSSRERIQVGSGHVLEAIAAQTAGVVVRFETQAALAESRDNFHTLFDSIDDFILILDQGGTIIDHNAALTRRLGRTSDELVGASLPDLHPPGMRDQAREVLSGLLDGRADHSDLPLIDAHQGLVPVETKVTRGRWGNQETLFAISRDMTERVRAESVLRDSEARHREVIASLSEGIVFHDLERDWTMLNPSAEEMLGLTPEEILGRAPLDPAWRAVHEDGTEFDIRCLPIRTCLADNRPVSGMVVGVVHGNGSTVWLSTGAKPLVREPGGAPFGVISSFADITALKRAQDEIKKSRQRYKELAIIDDLTRLYNSRQFFKQLTKEIRRTTRYKHHLSLVLMDIDDFKAYNDTWGHLEGDQVLMGLGRVIRDSIRKADTAYRYGGEEFVVLLPETPGSDAMRLAERIREGFAAIKFSPGGHALVSRTVSVGVTEFVPGEPASEFINRADKNMYEAKRRGKNISYLH
jgi:diguanylate cyclase (GGDEF)-like protein/PAS domain S-box-containing protein